MACRCMFWSRSCGYCPTVALRRLWFRDAGLAPNRPKMRDSGEISWKADPGRRERPSPLACPGLLFDAITGLSRWSAASRRSTSRATGGHAANKDQIDVCLSSGGHASLRFVLGVVAGKAAQKGTLLLGSASVGQRHRPTDEAKECLHRRRSTSPR
jgi:hypothetical protein